MPPRYVAHSQRGPLKNPALFFQQGVFQRFPYRESLNSRLRDELLDRELFTSVLEAEIIRGYPRT